MSAKDRRVDGKIVFCSRSARKRSHYDDYSLRLSVQVFPKHIAEALKAGIKPDIEHKPDVCVLFTDILNFEQLQQKLTPVQLADLMDRYFSKLDTLVQDLYLYKVGDARRAVSL